MAIKIIIKSLFLLAIICVAIPGHAQVSSYAEQFLAKPIEPKSVMRPDTPEDGLKNVLGSTPEGADDVLKDEERSELRHDSFMLRKVTFTGNTIYSAEDLKFLYQEQLNNLTNLKTLKTLAKKISSLYRKNGYILCRASLPTQNVVDGNVQIVVHEQGIKHISFTGDVEAIEHLKDIVQENLFKSSPFRLKDLQKQMNLLRSSAPIIVYPEFKPASKKSLDTKLVLVIKALPKELDDPLENEGKTFHLKNITLRGNTMIPTEDLELLFRNELDKHVTETKLQEIVKRISSFYRKQGYVLSRAFLPKQKIHEGSVYIVIREGTLHTVALEGDTKGIDPEKIAHITNAIDTLHPFHLKDLTKYIGMVQRLGHFHVYPSLKPLKTGTKADLVFSLQKMKPEEVREELVDKIEIPSNFKLTRVELAGNTAFSTDRLLEFAEDKMGKIISLRDVGEITQRITRFYRQEGYILSQAILPPQDVENGVIHIKVIEGYISEIIFEGDTYDIEDFLAHAAHSIKNSRPLHIKDLEGHLLRLKDLPHLNVTSTMRPSLQVKHSSTLIVTVKKHYWEGNVSGNNYGSSNVGPMQGTAQLSFVSPLSSAHKINVSGSKTYKPHELRLLQTDYVMPVGTRGAKVTFDGMASRSQPSSQNFQSDLQIYGTENRLGVSSSVPVLRGRYHNLYANFDFTYRNVESTSNQKQTNTMDRIRKVSAGFVLDFSDVLKGMNILRIDGIHGLPYLGATRKTQQTKSRLKGDPRFYMVNFLISRDQHLFGPFSLYGIAHGQVSFSPLLAAERFRGGGMPYNKAYPNSAITGDTGVEEKLELRFTQPVEKFLQHYMLYAYASRIRIWNRAIQPGLAETHKATASGIGIGGRATFQGGPTLELEYGRPTTSLVNNTHYKSKILMGFTYSMNNG